MSEKMAESSVKSALNFLLRPVSHSSSFLNPLGLSDLSFSFFLKLFLFSGLSVWPLFGLVEFTI